LIKYLFAVALSWSFDDPRLAHLLVPFAVLIRVGFFCLLRPGELTSLLAGDVMISFALDKCKQAIIAIRDPKTRNFMGRAQFALLNDDCTIKWLEWLLTSVPATMKLWPSNTATFRSIFNRVLARANITLGFSPASLRAGGATHMILEGYELGRLMFLGRWRTSTTLSSYIQEAMTQLVWAQLGASVSDMVIAAVAQSSSFWSTPPLKPWSLLFSRARQWRALGDNRRISSRKRIRFFTKQGPLPEELPVCRMK
jgi:hypothetical protein